MLRHGQTVMVGARAFDVLCVLVDHAGELVTKKKLFDVVWPGLVVECAFLELTTPDLSSTVESLMMQGKTHLRIVPMFLGVGRHAREDLPKLVADLIEAYPQVQFELVPSIGEHPAMTALMAEIAAKQATAA